MSKVTMRSNPAACATSNAPSTPAAGRRAASSPGWSAARSTSAAPPSLCTTCSAGTPRSAARASREVARHHRPHVGVQRRGRRALHLAVLRRDLRGEREEERRLLVRRAAPARGSRTSRGARRRPPPRPPPPPLASSARLPPSTGLLDAAVWRRRPCTRRSGRGRQRLGRLRLQVVDVGRVCRPIVSRSRKPSVVTSAVRAPRRSRTAFVATVVPWTTRSGVLPPSSVDTLEDGAAGSSGVEGRLCTSEGAVRQSRKSVKVPPTSTPRSVLTGSCYQRPRTEAGADAGSVDRGTCAG
jgi:hypothetical protein